MKLLLQRILLTAGFAGVFGFAHAQTIELRATINAAQETTASSSPATGSAIMLYDVASNTYDLFVTVNDLANTISNSHIHEAAAGVAGGVVSGIGAEAVYVRNGNTVTGTFYNLPYGGDKAKLLKGEAYYNLHSSQYPAGEVRGQLMAQPKKLVANINVAQEQATITNGTTINSNANGAAVMWYNPATGRISLRVSLFNLMNTFSNSHFHEALPGANGGVVTGLGGAAAYTSGGNGHYTGTFDIPYGGDPVKLLTGGAYLNFHSNVYPGGEIRGQVMATDELPGTRLGNLSARGSVGIGEQVLIQGFHISGSEPVRVMIVAKGPSLSAYGVVGALADPMLTLHDASGRQLATNDDFTAPAQGTELASIAGLPANAKEAALVVVLPPGTYSAIVSGAAGSTGVALLEITDMRGFGSAITTAQ